MKRTLAIAAAIVVALVFTFTVAGGAGATINLVVTTTADTHDANPGDGICADGTGACSLRAAIEESNDDCDTAITVSVGTYALTQGSLVVHCTVTLLGAGARTTTITRTGGSAFRIFEIASGTASISGVTITGGLADGTDVEDNPGVGAGVWIDNSGHLALLESTVTGNQASVSGGGIDSDGGLAVTRSTISNNSVTGSFLGIGGGIDDFGSSLDVADSTITGNSAVANGGGVLSASDATFVGDTIAGNTAAAGGGFFRYGLSNSQTFVNTIVSGNTGSDCSSPAPSSIGHNLTSDASCGFSGAGDLSSTDPLLGALHNNGGPTDTMLPALGSPAIDAGSDPACTGTDQRGVSRPQGAHCDIGALEVAAAAPSIADATRSTVSASPTSVPADFSTLSTITVTLKDASGTPLSGKTVSLTQSSGSAALGGPATTDGSGVAT
ncbi:MAG TPA: choice-of-anchor Q domain-containing protein, partial [Gaiellaceae bacterium]|nr:choice-of-anchor Q domain-containing protein [Gaiellaceae bacterium]